MPKGVGYDVSDSRSGFPEKKAPPFPFRKKGKGGKKMSAEDQGKALRSDGPKSKGRARYGG